MSFATKNIVCKCCGEEFQARVLKGFFSANVDLDSNPHQPELYEKAVLCPHCGYATSRINAEVDCEVRDAVSSPEYRKILMDETVPGPMRRLVLDARLMGLRHDDKSAGYQYLLASWYAREHRREYAELLKKAAEYLSEYLDCNADTDTAVVLIDCLRQLGWFADANEAAESLAAYVSDPGIERILRYEQALVNAGDVQPHSRNEVPS